MPIVRYNVLLVSVVLLMVTACGDSSPTPTPCPSDEEGTYLKKGIEILDSVDGGMTEIGRLFLLAEIDELLILDEQWMNLMAVSLLIVKLNIEEIRGITVVPASLLRLHSSMEEWADSLEKAHDAVLRAASTYGCGTACAAASDLLLEVAVSRIAVDEKMLEFLESCNVENTARR